MPEVQTIPLVIDADALELRWPRPAFKKLALQGEVTPRCALTHMLIYDQVGRTPARIDFVDLRQWRWPALWRAGVNQLRRAWEDRIEDVDAIQEEHFALLRSLTSGCEVDLSHCGAGRNSRTSANPVFPFYGRPRARLRNHVRLGWPHNPLLKDNDAFDVTGLRRDMELDWFWEINFLPSERRIQWIGGERRYASEEAAFADFDQVVSAYLERRASDEQAKAEAKKAARRMR